MNKKIKSFRMVDFNLKELFTPHPKKEDTSKRI
jgi:hypothetical protein